MADTYPRPIIADWTDPGAYPKAGELDADQWAWEFLRRNGEYQRLFDWFASLPDTMPLPDGTQTVKNGKRTGLPLPGLRFFENGACWYADPPPIPGESHADYHARHPEGEIRPFAEYLCRRFFVFPNPPDWRLAFESADFDFSDLYAPSIPPYDLDPLALLDRCQTTPPAVIEGMKDPYRDPWLVSFTFDVRHPLKPQLERARDMLKDQCAILKADPDRYPGFRPVRKVKEENRVFTVYLRLLDAAAAGNPPATIAAALYPGEDNDVSTGYTVSKRIDKALEAARRLTDGAYFGLLRW